MYYTDNPKTIDSMEALQPGDETLHICIHPQCGACGQLLLPGDRICALLFSHTTCQVYDARKFSRNGYAEQSTKDNTIFCKKPGCSLCLGAEESATMHIDCFDLCCQMLKNYRHQHDLGNDGSRESFGRLWLAATWRYAWRTMAPLKLLGSGFTNPPPNMIRKLCGFRKAFPPEIARMIQSHSPSSLVWRLCSTLEFMEELDSAKMHEAVTCSLSKVLCWSRGNLPKFVENEQTVGPYVRLITDYRGINSIERISESSANNTTFHVSSHRHVFITELAETMKTIEVEFQLGMSRLHIPMPSNISIWSAPVHIPDFLHLQSTERDAPLSMSSSSRFVATNLDPRHCTGISFFMRGSNIISIHGHSNKGLPSSEIFNYLDLFHTSALIWVYIPLTAADKINAIGVRSAALNYAPHSITLQMKSGQSIIGISPSNTPIFEASYKTAEQHPTLIHNTPQKGPISSIRVNTTPEIIYHGTLADEQPIPGACFSSASLDNVSNVCVFNDALTKLCKGIMIEYNNGLKRALGQCRLGLDLVQRYSRPLNLSYAITTYKPLREYYGELPKSVHVTFDPQDDLYHDNELKWEHHKMRGQLCFWFTACEVILQVSQD
ncbi:hypothetical protein J3F84DRAFT_366414 [Trichoderma pleuroticola]